MTAYAGEPREFRITNLRNFNATPITVLDVVEVTVTIYTSDLQTVVLSETEMPFNAFEDTWLYIWDTTGLPHGTYKAKIRVRDIDGLDSWEWTRVRLAKDPLEV